MPRPYNIANISSLAEFMPDIYNSFSQQKASGYPNSRTAPVPEINFYNDVNRDFLMDAINKHYSQNNALQIGPRYYQRDPNFIGPELYNQMTNGQDFASYISNPNNGYKIANEEEDEYDAGEDWKNAEIERRNLIQQNFIPLETPNYTQQAISALKPFLTKNAGSTALKTGVAAKTAADVAKAAKMAKVAKGFSIAGAGAGIAAEVGDHFLNKSYKGNQGAYVSGALGKNQFIDDVNNTNTVIASTNPYDSMQQYKNIEQRLNSQKTKKLSAGQRWGMVGVGAGKGAAMGATAGSLAGPIGTIVGTIAGTAIGAAAGAFKGHRANKQIDDTNEAANLKKLEAGNYLAYDFNTQHKRNALAQQQNAFNMRPYSYGGNLFANGGALQDPYGINYFATGSTHEKNPFGGIPVSIAPDGKPNLVEEGEVIYDDYVYSKRIKLPDSMRRQLNLKDDVKTFADAAKAIQERGKERPNDPVMEHTIKAQMQKLKSKQEEVKEKKEQREQEKLLAQMSEQERQMLEQQQMEQQANAYEQQLAAEQQAQMAQQMPQGQMAMQEQQPAMPYAEGGHLYKNGDSIKSDKTRKKDKDTLNEDISDYVVRLIKQIQDNNELSDEQKRSAYDNLFNKINEYQITHAGLRNQPLTPQSEAVRNLQNAYKSFGEDINDAIIGKNFEVGEGGITGDSAAKGWISDGYMGNETLARTLGYQLNDEQIAKVQQALKNAGVDNWSFKNNFSDKATDYSGFIKNDPTEINTEVTERPIYNWRYRPNWIPGAIDLGLLAQAYAPADYSRARSIENTPIREVQYNPNGNYFKFEPVDPRLMYNTNYANAQATNRAIQNNAGGNGANAVAAMIANNYNANVNAGDLALKTNMYNNEGFMKQTAMNNDVDYKNAQGFLQASEANQRADAQRGEFNYYGKMLRENIDKQRGQAISNSWGAVADDFNNYYNDRYNRGMIAGLAESGYFGEMPENSLLRKNIGFDVVGRESVDGRNYIEDENGIHYLTPNGVDYNIDGMNNVYLKNINGKYYKTNRV